MTIDAYTLRDEIQQVIDRHGIGDRFGVSISWPAHGAVDRPLTPADHAEAQRLANEKWWIEVRQ